MPPRPVKRLAVETDLLGELVEGCRRPGREKRLGHRRLVTGEAREECDARAERAGRREADGAQAGAEQTTVVKRLSLYT